MMELTALEAFLEQLAPAATAESWDNVGLLVDAGVRNIQRVVLALDATAAAIAYAGTQRADLLLTHHPVIFDPLSRLTANHPAALALAAGVSVFSMHTNLDKAPGGVNDTLAALLGLENITVAADGMTRVGVLPQPLSAAAFGKWVAARLHAPVALASGREVRRVAVCGGAGGDATAFADIDAYVTGEMKHHAFLAAQAANITVVAAGHYASEAPVLDTLAARLREACPALAVDVYAAGAPYTIVGE